MQIPSSSWLLTIQFQRGHRQAGGEGAGDHHPPLRPGRRPGADPEGGCRPAGNLPVLYFPIGKEDHQPLKEGNFEDELKKLRKHCFRSFLCVKKAAQPLF